ncbi:hypothetical protein HHK36_011118 [Tetracentron sinense]|uniref:Uncharacterized protein n=1 Tax=Tetracentron sinense TaxID=13715 RepID=A0A835DFW9_TETSI|nr:hypothetical protein HHK36_011118 [Tetracentron sinense]
MDRLWFHQIILSSEPISLLCPKTKTPHPIPETPPDLSPTPLLEEELSSDSFTSLPQDEDFEDNDDEDEKQSYKKKRPSRLNLATSETRSYSSSPSMEKRPKHFRYSGAVRRLRKTMSCKSLWELEYEEVKGFMDLGFTFKKEQLSPRMLSVVPGLQRLGESNDELDVLSIDTMEEAKDDEIDEEEEKSGVMRPYLSEAWLIKRPDSPLLNLRMPCISAAAEMKRHIQFWARTVASVIQQES